MSNEFIILPLASPNFDREEIDINEIRRLCSLGLDGYPAEDRAVAWLCLLNIYPKDPTNWPAVRQEIHKSYWEFVKDNGLENWHNKNLPNQMSSADFQLKNNKLMAIVHGDIVRTGRTIFLLPPDAIPSDTPPADDDIFMYQYGRHARRLERVLYTFASLNVGLGYMQGFNELIIPFYYVFISALPFFNNDMDLLESFTFQSLQVLLTESPLHELYTTTDKSSIIMHRLDEFSKLVEKFLPDVSKVLESLNIHPVLYSFRWFNLLFCQEYELPNLISIWDSLFSHFDRLVDFVFYVGLGHLNEIQSSIVPNNYPLTITALQSMPQHPDPKRLLIYANQCWNEDNNHTKKRWLFSRK